ncbi:MAG: hypothetical protein EBU66_09585 [Bacteroidetes bacterium]|nr:hypothetical protein [Bacteroidota bacterium]
MSLNSNTSLSIRFGLFSISAIILLTFCALVANIAQISGCMGFQAVEGHLPPKKYNNRSLPYFHQNDDRIKARGLIRESFFEGLDFKQ